MSEILLVNPRRRRRRKKTATRKRRTSVRRKNPVKRRRRKTVVRRRSTRRRRNPVVSAKGVQGQLMNAAVGATGALGLDLALGYLPIPANLKGGLVGTGVKAMLAIAIGIVGQKTKLVKSSTAATMANGALTVVLHDELKKQVANFAPNLQLGEYIGYGGDELGYYGSGANPGPVYLPELSADGMDTDESGFGEYVSGSYVDDFSM